MILVRKIQTPNMFKKIGHGFRPTESVLLFFYRRIVGFEIFEVFGVGYLHPRHFLLFFLFQYSFIFSTLSRLNLFTWKEDNITLHLRLHFLDSNLNVGRKQNKKK